MPEGDINNQNPMPTPEQLTQAATAGPQPQLSATLMGTPTATAPATEGTPPAPAATPAPKPDAQAAIEQHHSVLGRVASALLGHNLDYQVDPQTGKTVAVETPQRPGQFFRNLVAGALLGGVAARGTNSVLSGFSRGATAGIEANQAADQQRYSRAQQGFKTQQEAQRTQREQGAESREDQRLKDEELKTSAQHEMWNKEQLLHERDANLRESEFLQRQNENSQ